MYTYTCCIYAIMLGGGMERRGGGKGEEEGLIEG